MTLDEAIGRIINSNGRDSHLLPKVIDGYLYLCRCTSLTSLPKGLTVHGSLFLSGCTSLLSLSEGLTVGRNLYLDGCTSLRSIANATAELVLLSKDHKIPDAEIAMARFSGIEVIIQ